MAATDLLDVAARHALSVRWDRLADQERVAATRLVADSVAVGIAAAGSEVIERLDRALDGGSGDADVQVLGRGRRTLADAVLLNCALVRQLDLMDVFWDKDVCHPSENVPVALSVGESYGASGRQVLEAVVAGYDIQIWLCRLMSFADIGLHHVSAGGVAAPLLMARIRGLDLATAIQAAALTVYRSVTLGVLSRGDVSTAKSFSYGLIAADALRALRFAECGLTGPRQALDWLVCRLARAEIGPEESAAALGAGTVAVAIKRYPVQFALQGPVEAAVVATRERRLDSSRPAGDIESIVVRAPQWTIDRTTDTAKYRPTTRETADHSLPVCVAMAALDGDLTVGSMLAGRWSDRDVLALAQRVRVERDTELEVLNPGGGPGIVELVLDDARRYTSRIDHPVGDPRRPMSDEQLRAKFAGLVEPRLGRQRGRELWGALMSLDQTESVADVMALTKEAR